MNKKMCIECSEEKDISKFTMNGKYRRNVCNSCRNSKGICAIRVNKVVENNPRYNFDITKVFRSVDYILKELPKPRYCKYDLCKSLLHKNNKDKYCDSWCEEMDNLPEVKHLCKKCGIVVPPFKRYSGDNGKYYISSGVYPNFCKRHEGRGKHKNKKL